MLSLLRTLLGGFRPPRPRQSVPLSGLRQGRSVVTLAGAMAPHEAVETLLNLIEVPQGRALVVPSVAMRPAMGAHPHVVATLLRRLGPDAQLGLPSHAPAPVRRRWEQLASRCGATTVTLGRRGWDRIELSGDEFMLDEVYIPAELRDAAVRIAVPAINDDSLALGFLREIVHPHTRLRARGNERRVWLDAEIAASQDMLYLLDASRLSGRNVPAHLVAWSEDAVSAELVAIGVRRHLDMQRGFESVTAWEHERIQAATELGVGPPAGTDLELRVASSSGDVAAVATFLQDELSCQVEWLEAGGAG